MKGFITILYCNWHKIWEVLPLIMPEFAALLTPPKPTILQLMRRNIEPNKPVEPRFSNL